jgi:hypothetical protein
MLKTKCSSLQALFDLENTNSDLKSDLKDLFINSAVYVHNCMHVLCETFPSYSFNFLSSLWCQVYLLNLNFVNVAVK